MRPCAEESLLSEVRGLIYVYRAQPATEAQLLAESFAAKSEARCTSGSVRCTLSYTLAQPVTRAKRSEALGHVWQREVYRVIGSLLTKRQFFFTLYRAQPEPKRSIAWQ